MIAEFLARVGFPRDALGLQWGRDHVIAELPGVIQVALVGKVWLQWGRDHVIAEFGATICWRSP